MKCWTIVKAYSTLLTSLLENMNEKNTVVSQSMRERVKGRSYGYIVEAKVLEVWWVPF